MARLVLEKFVIDANRDVDYTHDTIHIEETNDDEDPAGLPFDVFKPNTQYSNTVL